MIIIPNFWVEKVKILVLMFLLAILQTYYVSSIVTVSKANMQMNHAHAIRAEGEIANNTWSHGEWTVDGLLKEREGFGRNVTGGLGGKVYYVTSLANGGPGSLREAAERTEPLWIVFEVSGTINLESPITVMSDKTFDGRGAEIIITGYGFHVDGVSNIIMTNLRFDTSKEPDVDAVRIYLNSHDIWVHRCDFTNYSDGAVDITRGSTDVTVSWCRFWDHRKTMLIGADPSHTGDVVIRVTLHHNYFFRTGQRHPRLRFGKVDAYNNYLYGWRSYGMGVAMYGELLAESNIFEAEEDKDAVIARVGSEEKGYVKLVGNMLLNGASAEDNDPEKVFERSTFYTVTIETPDDVLKQKIMALAGSQIPTGPRIMTDAKDSSEKFNYRTLFQESLPAGASINFYAVIPPFRRHTDKIISCEWDFGDGNTATGLTTSHTYPILGTYTVTLELEDEAGTVNTVSTSVKVIASLPIYWLASGILAAAILGAIAILLRRSRK